MTTTAHYQTALQNFRLRYFLPIVLAFNGNICEASRQCGVHRNTITRTLAASGYDAARLRRLAHSRKREAA